MKHGWFFRCGTCAFVGVLILSAAIATGCAKVEKRTRPAGRTMFAAQHGDEETPFAVFGKPEHRRDWSFGPSRVLVRGGYIIEHSSIDKVPIWVCEHLEGTHLDGSAERGSFKPDPDIPGGERAELADYRGSGYDRGHNAPAGDFKSSQDLMNQTFYLSNMSPQVGPNFNQSIWRVLEDRVRECARSHGSAFVITGSMFWDPKEDDPHTADGIVEYFTIGDNEVAVPTHWYKIVIFPGDANTLTGWSAVAFVMENKPYPRQRDEEYDYSGFVHPITFIEQRTGLNFMPKLDEGDSAHHNLATQLESSNGEIPACLAPRHQ